MKPAVSIITPYLDAGDFLAEAINSVEKQEFGGWELILVDDGSSDGSRAIADQAGRRDPRIRSLARPSEIRAGAAAARNWGIGQAKGDFLVFLDADDRLLPDKLRTEIGLMQRYPEAGMTCGGTIWWFPGEERRNWSDEARALRPGLYDGSVPLNRAMLLQRIHVPCLCAVMLRRSALPPGPPFEESFALYEDQTLLAKMMLSAPVYVGWHLTALYRQHGQSTSSRAEESGEYQRLAPHSARTRFLHWVRDYVGQTATATPAIKEALAIAEAVQSGEGARLTPRLRARLLGFALQDRVKRLTRPFRRVFRRRSALSSTRASGE